MSQRDYSFNPAVRERVPLLIGLAGPSGSGKTFTALRLATGMAKVTKGPILFIDTENRRGLHYAENFQFKHFDFGAPFASLDYLAAMQEADRLNPSVIVVDSMSHEHEGPGGMIDYQVKELDRMAGDDYGKRERMQMLAWQKPKAARSQMIAGILQLPANFIFNFRAKEKLKVIPGKPPIQQGFMPIAGDELVFEMTVNCLLLPHADGVPTWRSDQIGERMMMKLPEQFREIFREEQPLSEDIGQKLAAWAKGGTEPAAKPHAEAAVAGNVVVETHTAPSDDVPGDPLLDMAREKATDGAAVFNAWRKRLSFPEQDRLEAWPKDIKDELAQRMRAAKEQA